MEGLIDFLKIESGYGSGDGSGDGDGYGDGYGDGSGYGDGDGDGYGYGYGDGYGSGDGYGDGSGYGTGCNIYLKSINGQQIHDIDEVATIITSLRNNIAKGFVVNNDLSLAKCFIVKQNNLFAHGETLKQAVKSLQDKLFEDMPTEERIELFLQEFDIGEQYPVSKFYEWHYKLTGSCEFGRQNFMQNKGLKMDDSLTVDEFIKLTENEYGGEVIREIKILKGE